MNKNTSAGSVSGRVCMWTERLSPQRLLTSMYFQHPYRLFNKTTVNTPGLPRFWRRRRDNILHGVFLLRAISQKGTFFSHANKRYGFAPVFRSTYLPENAKSHSLHSLGFIRCRVSGIIGVPELWACSVKAFRRPGFRDFGVRGLLNS
jgi:hypothetical protein